MRKRFSHVIILIAVVAVVSGAWRESAASVQTGKGKGGGAAAVYKQHCAKCHLDDGKGLESLDPPNFTDAKWQADHSDKKLADAIRDGKEVMPGFKDTLSPAQITALVRYVRAFGPKAAKPAKKP